MKRSGQSTVFKNPLSIQIAAGNAGIVSFYYILVTKSVLFDTWLSFTFILHSSPLRDICVQVCAGPRRSLTSFRTSCTTTASVWWRSRCWSPSFQRRLTLPLVRTHTCTRHTHTHTLQCSRSDPRLSLTPPPLLSAAPGYSVPTVANGIGRYPSFGDASSRPVQPSPFSGQHSVTVSRGGVHTPTACSMTRRYATHMLTLNYISYMI